MMRPVCRERKAVTGADHARLVVGAYLGSAFNRNHVLDHTGGVGSRFASGPGSDVQDVVPGLQSAAVTTREILGTGHGSYLRARAGS